MENDGVAPEITRQSILKLKAPLTPQLQANLLRQQSSIETVDPSGTHLPQDSVEFSMSKPGDTETAKKMKVWTNLFTAVNYPTLEVGRPENSNSLVDLTRLISSTRKLVKEYVESGSDRRRELHDLVTQNSLSSESLVYQAILSQEKINVILDQPGISPALRETLSQMQLFLSQDLIPHLGLTKPERTNLEETIKLTLTNSPDGRDPYVEKVQRIFTSAKADRASSFILGIGSSEMTDQVPFRIQMELLAAANEVNHLRLLEMLETQGIDIVKTRENVAEILSRQPPHSVDNSKVLSPEETKWFGELLGQIAPITNAVEKNFPHDTTFMLGQALEKHQAVCAGKADMVTRLMQDVGLNALPTDVDSIHHMHNKNTHAITHIILPDDLIVSLDTNWNELYLRGSMKKNYPFLKHMAAILLPTGQTLNSPADVETFLASKPEGTKTLIVDHLGHHLYTTIGDEHPITSHRKLLASINLSNTAAGLHNMVIGLEQKTLRELRMEIFNQSLDLNNNDSLVFENLANLEIVSGDFDSARKHLLSCLKINPINSQALFLLGKLYRDHPASFTKTDKTFNPKIEVCRAFAKAKKADPDNREFAWEFFNFASKNTEIYSRNDSLSEAELIKNCLIGNLDHLYDTPSDKPKTYQNFLQLAQRTLQLKEVAAQELDTILAQLDRACKLNPDSLELELNRLKIYKANIQRYKRDPEHFQQSAIKTKTELENALTRFPADIQIQGMLSEVIYNYIGIVSENSEQKAELIQQAYNLTKDCLTKNPNNPHYHNLLSRIIVYNLSILTAANVESRSNLITEAKQHTDQAIEISKGKNPDYYYTKGALLEFFQKELATGSLSSQDLLVLAADSYYQATEIDPKNQIVDGARKKLDALIKRNPSLHSRAKMYGIDLTATTQSKSS